MATKLLHPPSSQPETETHDSCQKRCNDIGIFFVEKVKRVKDLMAQKLSARVSLIDFADPQHQGPRIDVIKEVSREEVAEILSKMTFKFSPVDVIPSSLIKLCPGIFAELISRLANLSFQSGTFPTSYKSAQIKPLLKKHGRT